MNELRNKAAGFIEKGWCQQHIAENEIEECVDPLNPTAVKWCLHGALLRAGGNDERLDPELNASINRIGVELHLAAYEGRSPLDDAAIRDRDDPDAACRVLHHWNDAQHTAETVIQFLRTGEVAVPEETSSY